MFRGYLEVVLPKNNKNNKKKKNKQQPILRPDGRAAGKKAVPVFPDLSCTPCITRLRISEWCGRRQKEEKEKLKREVCPSALASREAKLRSSKLVYKRSG